MIDTLKLNISDCSIDSKTQLVIEPSPYLHDSQQKFINYDLFCDNEGEIVQGKKAYLNKDKYNLTIKPKYTLKLDAVDKRTITGKFIDGLKVHEIKRVQIPEESFNAGIFVQTSLPRFFNSTNFNSLSIQNEKDVINKLEKELWKDGIKTNIWNATLSRVDTFTNITLSENFTNYSAIFNILELARMQRFEYAGTTFLYRNGEQQICIYDKLLEMKNKITDFKRAAGSPRNIMRIENRLLRKRKILNTTGFTNVKQLYKNYDILKSNYKNQVSITIFKYEPGEKKIVTGEAIMEGFANSLLVNGLRGMNKYLKEYGLESILLDVPLENLLISIDNSDFSRMQKSRLRSMFKKKKLDMEFLKTYKSEKTNLQLYQEIKSKFFKNVA